MRTLVSAQDIHFRYDSTPLFEGLNFSLNDGDKVAIVGHNGCGKSTLLSIIDRQLTPERGLVTHARDMTYATVEQFLPAELEDMTVREVMLAKLTPEQRQIEAYRADIALDDLFFDAAEFDVPIRALSGGQRNRLMLARAIVSEPDLVLMDEPTNHMDVQTLLFVEDYLTNKARFSFAVISHDRRFLDRVTTKTIVVRDGVTQSFDLPYSRAMEQLAQMDEHAHRARAQQEKEIARLEASARRLAMWGKNFDNEDLARKAKSMEKRIEKLAEQKTFVSSGNPYRLQLETGATRSKLALQFHDYPVFYGPALRPDGGNLLFSIGECHVRTGERVAILGANGVGKTTFLQGIAAQLQSGDERAGFRRSPNLELGLYDQEQRVLDDALDISEEIHARVEQSADAVKKALIAAGFAYRDHNKRIAALSGGERARLIFLILSLLRPNFLILDEPTNHIDLDGRRELEEMLLASDATVLVTGHDRAFIDRVADRLLMIRGGALTEIQTADVFYDGLLRGDASRERSAGQAPDAGAEPGAKDDSDADEDAILAQIEELEQKLADDRARKAKFQKPARQAAWKAGIEALYALLDE